MINLKMQKRGFTIIEMIAVILLLAILAVAFSGIFFQVFNISMFLPKSANVNLVAQEIIDTVFEGDPEANGLRFASSIILADENEVTYNTFNDEEVDIRYDASDERVYRSIDGGAEIAVPYFSSNAMDVKGQSAQSTIFKYYDGSSTELSVPVSDPTEIAYVRVDIIVETGSGVVKEFDSRIEITGGCEIHQYTT